MFPTNCPWSAPMHVGERPTWLNQEASSCDEDKIIFTKLFYRIFSLKIFLDNDDDDGDDDDIFSRKLGYCRLDFIFSLSRVRYVIVALHHSVVRDSLPYRCDHPPIYIHREMNPPS